MGGIVRGEEGAPGGEPRRRTKAGPRHAAPKKSMLTRLQVPAGKAIALAAMPTAVLMGMGLTPQLAQADTQAKDRFKPGPCVTQPDEPQDGTEGKDDKNAKGSKDDKDGKAGQDGKDPQDAKGSDGRGEGTQGRTGAPDGDRTDQGDQQDAPNTGQQPGSSPTGGPSSGAARTPDGSGTSAAPQPAAHEPSSGVTQAPEPPAAKSPATDAADPEPAATPSPSRHPLDPLGLGDALKDLLGGGKHATPTAPQPSTTPKPSATPRPDATGDGADAPSTQRPTQRPTTAHDEPSGKGGDGSDATADGAAKDQASTVQEKKEQFEKAQREADAKAERERAERRARGEESAKPGATAGTHGSEGAEGTADDTGSKDGDEGDKGGEGDKDGAEPSAGPTLPSPDDPQPYPCPVRDEAALRNAPLEADAPLLPEDPWILESSLLALHGLKYDGIVKVKTFSGREKAVLKFTASSIDIHDLKQTVVGPGSATTHVDARPGSNSTMRNGTVTMYTEELKGNLLGIIPVTFSPDAPPPLTFPELFFTKVRVTQAGQFGGTLTVPGMHLYQTGK
ncbi:hydrogenase expression protein HypF [Streptomyces sp. 796.1]|uniref:hydrogenase expression protein HypF n=1 Tax=Streptomyces sp. 796.1 TaxID=3163029 RepID=UPI0039C8DE47